MGVEAKNKKGSRNDRFYHHGEGCGRRSRVFLRGTRQNGGPRGLRGAHVRAHQGVQLGVDHIALVWGKLLVMPGEVPLQLQLVRHLDRLVQVGDEI